MRILDEYCDFVSKLWGKPIQLGGKNKVGIVLLQCLSLFVMVKDLFQYSICKTKPSLTYIANMFSFQPYCACWFIKYRV